jgi:hypothetical protein
MLHRIKRGGLVLSKRNQRKEEEYDTPTTPPVQEGRLDRLKKRFYIHYNYNIC